MTKFLLSSVLCLLALPAFCDTPNIIAKDTNCVQNETKCEFTVYLTSPISDPIDYDLLMILLQRAKEGDVMTFIINSPGGSVDTMIMITDAIHASRAHTISEVHGMAASAAAMIAQSTDELIVSPGSTLMFHEVQLGGGGTASTIVPRMTKLRAFVNQYMRSELHDFMTPEELDNLFKGDEFWMGDKEVQQRLMVRNFIRSLRHTVESVLGLKHERT